MTSPLRQEQAQLTRHRIMDAAYALLLEVGYARTTITAVAERAGVAVPTIYKGFGSKAQLAKKVYDRTLAGDDADAPLGDRPQAKELLAERDPQQVIKRYATLVTELSTRLGPLLAVLLAAQSTEPQLQEFVTTIERERRAGNERFAAHLDDIGGLTVDDRRACDVLWLFTAPEVHQRLVRQRGWTADEFRDWLAETLTTQFLGNVSH
ncbi:TetR/AcrR family transcriptional regulator [Streptomyces sp. NPDC005500]|uniref:TetR/AcrR family transcriptional regulator n=1 Tax=Streptomyces sp. NPDC005500 TaxID=3155007 RepID=UPI0033A3720A